MPRLRALCGRLGTAGHGPINQDGQVFNCGSRPAAAPLETPGCLDAAGPLDAEKGVAKMQMQRGAAEAEKCGADERGDGREPRHAHL